MNTSRVDTNQITEEQLKAAPESEYMNAEQLAFFKHKLEALYASTGIRIQEAKDEMTRPLEDFSDANDRASWEEQANIALRIVEREQKLLPKIQKSLERIRLGTYGYCLESDEPIGIPRLLVRPTAEYCAEVKAVQELKEDQYRD